MQSAHIMGHFLHFRVKRKQVFDSTAKIVGGAKSGLFCLTVYGCPERWVKPNASGFHRRARHVHMVVHDVRGCQRLYVHILRKVVAIIFGMDYGAMIKEARQAAGMTQAELGEAIQLDRSMVGKIEAGKVFVEPETYRRLVFALPSLRPVELLNALGYEVPTSGATRLPPELVRILGQLDAEQRQIVLRLARGLLAENRSPQ